MYPYKMLILNRIREYKRLFSVMKIPLLGLLIFAGIVFYYLTTEWFDMIRSIHLTYDKVRRVGVGMLIVYSICRIITANRKCSIIMKPMTLYLFNETKIRWMVLAKFIKKLPKILIVSYLLTVCMFGTAWTSYEISVCVGIVCFLENIEILRWAIYHSVKRKKIQCIGGWILYTGLFLLGCCNFKYQYKYEYQCQTILHGVICVLSMLLVLWKVTINLSKYVEEMDFQQRLLTAQNYNNTVLLKSYIIEKRLRHIKGTNRLPIWGKKFPILWKNMIACSRTLRFNIIIAVSVFITMLGIYNVEIFWNIPVLDIPEIRHGLLIMGVAAIYQITIQAMLECIDELNQKSIDGLFVPLDRKNMLWQCSLPAIVIEVMLSLFVGILMKKSAMSILIFSLLIGNITILIFYLEFVNRNFLRRIYGIFSVVIMAIAFLMTVAG